MYDDIEKQVARFTHKWHENKLKQFINPSHGYDQELQVRLVKTAGFNSSYNEDTGETYSEIAWEEIEEVTLGDFCWCDEERYYEQREFYPDEKLDPFDAISVVGSICESIDELISSNDVQANFNIINSASNIFSEAMHKLISNPDSNGQFIQTCSFITEKGILMIRKRFERIVQQYIYGNESIINLDFELNKQQLAALIFLVDEAGMLTEKARGAFGKYEFFEKYFYWTNSSDFSKNKLTGIKKNISDFKSGNRLNSVNEVFEMIKKANNNYIRPKR